MRELHELSGKMLSDCDKTAFGRSGCQSPDENSAPDSLVSFPGVTTPKDSFVYIVAIGKLAKIGYSTNIPQRLRSFATGTGESIRLLASFRGERADERRLHLALAEYRVRGEFFHLDHRLLNFIDFVRAGDLKSAWKWLAQTTPRARQKKARAIREQRLAAARTAKAERDAHCARLVAERKQRLGW